MKPTVSLRTALNDPGLLGSILAGPTWQAHRVCSIAAFGEPLDDDERKLFKQLTHRDHEPDQPVEQYVAVVGRRGGKSRCAATLAAYIAGLCQHPNLVPGETGILLIIAQDQRTADVILDFCDAAFRASPILRQLIRQRTARSLILTNNIEIEVRASDFRRLRGPTYIAVIADELAFWYGDGSANPDAEILTAVKPGLGTTGGPLFLLSSPYARHGELWKVYNKHFGPAGDPLVLVAQGSTATFNPSYSERVIARAYEHDTASAAAEYGAQFRSDLEAFVSLEAVTACVSKYTIERKPLRGTSYVGFVDPSGGSSDSMTLSVGHYDPAKEVAVIDCLREFKPPFSPEQVVSEFAVCLRSYYLSACGGDRYAGEWPREQFSKFGINYIPAEKPKSDLYRDLLPLLNSRRVDLLDNPKLIGQLVSLERRTARGGRDSIDHPPSAHDDLANVVAGVAVACVTTGNYVPLAAYRSSGDGSEADSITRWRRFRMWQHIQNSA